MSNPTKAVVIGTPFNYVTVLSITLDFDPRSPRPGTAPGNPCDRIIAATQSVHCLRLPNKDANITDAGAVATLW